MALSFTAGPFLYQKQKIRKITAEEVLADRTDLVAITEAKVVITKEVIINQETVEAAEEEKAEAGIAGKFKPKY